MASTTFVDKQTVISAAWLNDVNYLTYSIFNGLSAVPSAGTVFRSNGTNVVASTSTFADTYGINTLLYASAANAVTGLATVNSAVLTTSAGGVPTWSTVSSTFPYTIGIGQGGTGQTTANPAFNALAPTTTKGDLIVSTGTVNARQAVGTDGQILRADSSQTNGVSYGAPAGILAGGRNISCRTNSVTPNTKIDLNADEFVVRNSTNGSKLATNIAVTVDFGTVGANGLDVGTQAASTWYYLWVIMKEDGTTAGLGSTSSSAPTMPSGYTYKGLISVARSDGSVHFIKYRQFGNWCYYEAKQSIGSALSATIETALSTSTQIPPNALSVQLALSYSNTGGADSTTIRYVTGSNFFVLVSSVASVASNGICIIPNVGQNIYYQNTAVNGSLAIDCQGFKLPGGGE